MPGLLKSLVRPYVWRFYFGRRLGEKAKLGGPISCYGLGRESWHSSSTPPRWLKRGIKFRSRTEASRSGPVFTVLANVLITLAGICFGDVRCAVAALSSGDADIPSASCQSLYERPG
jgi:hypothetical protein